ncbi:MAG: hypothetical protein HPAVJP_5370 [Candidatus Hepatoplasma vulgare]|nr:MAG: hypothetical protein HPAVJP_5370 [Candidatus Hepatoplasma sp.]
MKYLIMNKENNLILEKKFNLKSLSLFLELSEDKILKKFQNESFNLKKNGFLFKVDKMSKDLFLVEFRFNKRKEFIMLFFPFFLLIIRREIGFVFLSIFTLFIANIYIYFREKRNLLHRYLDLGFIVK